jgi:hypothetical protein
MSHQLVRWFNDYGAKGFVAIDVFDGTQATQEATARVAAAEAGTIPVLWDRDKKVHKAYRLEVAKGCLIGVDGRVVWAGRGLEHLHEIERLIREELHKMGQGMGEATAPGTSSQGSDAPKGKEQDEVYPVRCDLRVEPPFCRPGGTLKARVTFTLDEGYHLYTPDSPQSDTAPLPLSLTVAEGPFKLSEGWKPDRPPAAGPDLMGNPTRYHEGKVTYTASLKAAETLSLGMAELRIAVRGQACSDTVCLDVPQADFDSGIQPDLVTQVPVLPRVSSTPPTPGR